MAELSLVFHLGVPHLPSGALPAYLGTVVPPQAEEGRLSPTAHTINFMGPERPSGKQGPAHHHVNAWKTGTCCATDPSPPCRPRTRRPILQQRPRCSASCFPSTQAAATPGCQHHVAGPWACRWWRGGGALSVRENAGCPCPAPTAGAAGEAPAAARWPSLGAREGGRSCG